MMAEFLSSLWLTPPSSAGVPSYEDKANSHNDEGYSTALKGPAAAPRVGDGDASHIAT